MLISSQEECKINELLDLYYRSIGDSRFLYVLQQYSNCKGYGSPYCWCCFANQVEEWDEDYFGENKVAYYFDPPAVDEDYTIIFSNEEFYKYLSIKCENYIDKFPDKKEDVLMYLRKTKLNLGV